MWDTEIFYLVDAKVSCFPNTTCALIVGNYFMRFLHYSLVIFWPLLILLHTYTANDLRRTYIDCSYHISDFPLVAGWKNTLPVIDQGWISETFFRIGTRGPEFDFSRVTKLWYDPPQPSLSPSVMNSVERYFGHRLFLWMPRHFLQVLLVCPHPGCQGTLVNAGVNQKTRMVLDVDSYYCMAAEYLSCNQCNKKVSVNCIRKMQVIYFLALCEISYSLVWDNQ